jgi:hypothetical protein
MPTHTVPKRNETDFTLLGILERALRKEIESNMVPDGFVTKYMMTGNFVNGTECLTSSSGSVSVSEGLKQLVFL